MPRPLQRKRLPTSRAPIPGPASYNRLDEVWRKEREAEDPRYVGRRDALKLGHFGNCAERPGFEHPLPTVGTGKRLDQCVVGLALLRGTGGQLRLRAAALHEAEGDVQRHSVGDRHHRVSCGALHEHHHHFAGEAAEPVDAEAHVQSVHADVDPFDQQRQDARLLGDGSVPHRIERVSASHASAAVKR